MRYYMYRETELEFYCHANPAVAELCMQADESACPSTVDDLASGY